MKFHWCLLVLILWSAFHSTGQILVYQQPKDRINLEKWIDLGLSRCQNPRKQKGFYSYDSLYVLSYRDSLGAMINASPIFSFWLGRENGMNGLKHQNSRGLLVTAGHRKFSCFALIMENQAFLAEYQNQFIKSHGEFYPGTVAYSQQNGMVPGGGRTKPFKNTGFDYSYSQGGMEWDLTSRISIFGGNCSLNISEGMRSLFWSSHNQAAVIGTKIILSPHIQYFTIKGRLFDLIRKPSYANVESPYYKKGYSMNGLMYTAKKFRAGILYQTIWKGGDSIKEHPLSSWFWSPLPGFDHFASNYVSLPQWGLIGHYQPISSLLLYGEAFCRGLNKNDISYQVGATFFPASRNGWTFSLNTAINHVGTSFYGDNYTLSFSNNNLPLGSLLGNGTQELLLSSKLKYKRFYLGAIMQYYTSLTGKTILFRDTYSVENKVFHGIGEIGFVLNPLTQCVIFTLFDYRNGSTSLNTKVLTFGIKTAIFTQQHVY